MRKQRKCDKMKFSVIIPVYNCADRLHISVESIFQQTYGDFELILVNDGSTDNSLDICNEYASKDCRVKVLNQKNSGPSVARNTGLKYVSGEYVVFCDADDCLEKEALEKIIKEIRNNDDKCDIVFYGYYDSAMENGSIIKRNKHTYNHSVFNSNTALKEKYNDLNNISFTYPVWNKAYRLQFVKESKAEFPVGVNIAEDYIFNLKLYTKAERTIVMSEWLYNYIQHSGSITTKFQESKINSAEYVYEYAVKVMEKWNPNMVNCIHNAYLKDISVYINNMFNSNVDLSVTKKIELVRSVIRKESVRICIKDVKCSSFRNKMICMLIKYRMALLLLLTGKIARLKCRKKC